MSRRANRCGGRSRGAGGVSSPACGGGAVSLAELETGSAAKVLRVLGDGMLAGRMEALGIVPGAIIRKQSAIPAHGPIVVVKGPVRLALSHDMGRAIFVEPAGQHR